MEHKLEYYNTFSQSSTPTDIANNQNNFLFSSQQFFFFDTYSLFLIKLDMRICLLNLHNIKTLDAYYYSLRFSAFFYSRFWSIMKIVFRLNVMCIS